VCVVLGREHGWKAVFTFVPHEGFGGAGPELAWHGV